ncbi:uncharacterized protein LOC128639111 isoform X2 [Bombina bombina]|uniref:uncharacterized protein LOC128639111 isoform X2 n=1 Tax=Bombina bombina TaxID=8345 RepID=UPI00235AD679|nr:uncharacterized protein LOC128639111 isoform X2 [Bombina bombina]
MPRLIIGDLDPEMSEGFLFNALRSRGENVVNVTIHRNSFTGMPSGYGYIEFPDWSSTDRCYERLNGKVFALAGPGKRFELQYEPGPHSYRTSEVQEAAEFTEAFVFYTQTFSNFFTSMLVNSAPANLPLQQNSVPNQMYKRRGINAEREEPRPSSDSVPSSSHVSRPSDVSICSPSVTSARVMPSLGATETSSCESRPVPSDVSISSLSDTSVCVGPSDSAAPSSCVPSDESVSSESPEQSDVSPSHSFSTPLPDASVCVNNSAPSSSGSKPPLPDNSACVRTSTIPSSSGFDCSSKSTAIPGVGSFDGFDYTTKSKCFSGLEDSEGLECTTISSTIPDFGDFEDPMTTLDVNEANRQFIQYSEDVYNALMDCHWQPLDSVTSSIPS